VNVLVLIIGVGALAGVMAGGMAGDALMRRGRVSGRVTVAAVTAALAGVLFVPAVLSSGAFVRSPAQAMAPLLFGAMSDHVFGGGCAGLQWTSW
jgi:ABC-type methionine transport system permease subunit